MNTQQYYLIAGAVLIVLALGAYLLVYKQGAAPQVTTPTGATSTSDVVATSSAGSLSVKTTGGAVIKVIPGAAAVPNYQVPLVFASTVSAEVRAGLNSHLPAIQAALTKDKYDFNAWTDLGTLRLLAGDAPGAREIWDYVSKVWPANIISFNNLGDYYASIQNYPAAESNYLTAIKNKSDDTNPYRNLFTLYSNVYKKGTPAAEDILKKAIAANPKAVDMQVLLARYYRDTGRTTDAKAEYQAAIDNATSQGQTSLAAQIQAEKDAF